MIVGGFRLSKGNILGRIILWIVMLNEITLWPENASSTVGLSYAGV